MKIEDFIVSSRRQADLLMSRWPDEGVTTEWLQGLEEMEDIYFGDTRAKVEGNGACGSGDSRG